MEDEQQGALRFGVTSWLVDVTLQVLHHRWQALQRGNNSDVLAVHHVGGYSHFFEYLIEVAGLRIHLKHSQAHSKCAEE